MRDKMNKLKLLARTKELYETEGTNIIEYPKSVDSLVNKIP